MAEGQQLGPHCHGGRCEPTAEPVGERHEDLERFSRDGHALVHGHELERSHVVQPVGELDHLVRVRLRAEGEGEGWGQGNQGKGEG